MKKYRLHAIIGNHDCYYKDTNYAPELLLNDYSNQQPILNLLR